MPALQIPMPKLAPAFTNFPSLSIYCIKCLSMVSIFQGHSKPKLATAAVCHSYLSLILRTKLFYVLSSSSIIRVSLVRPALTKALT